MAAQHIIGIDLGTTNCALADVDTALGEAARPELQLIEQLVNPGEPAATALLPSCLFLPGPADFAAGATALPWEASPTAVVGELARKRGAENPARLVTSAKSWLSYAAVDRTSALLVHQHPLQLARDALQAQRVDITHGCQLSALQPGDIAGVLAAHRANTDHGQTHFFIRGHRLLLITG